LVEIEGFKILMYHGASFHGVVEQNLDIRMKNKHNNPTVILKELLRARHLAPTHGECDYIIGENKDNMVLDVIPDIILTGDLHRSEVLVYNNILLIASSCWQSITPFEEKVGNNPDPCKVPILNLKTRELKILDFSGQEEKEHVNVSGERIVEKQEVKVEAAK
jgi:DNA polymerase II small subunit